MGELFNTQQEYVPLIAEPADRLHPHPHLADRRPEHGAEGGGALRVLRREDRLARARRRLAGRPRRRAGLELASHNFGIHEGDVFPPETRDVFPGCPETKDGYLYANEAPGLGIDIDEKLAAKFPVPDDPHLRPPLGHDPAARRDGDPALVRAGRRRSPPPRAGTAVRRGP